MMGFVLDIYFHGKRVKERVKNQIFEDENDVFKYFERVKNDLRYPTLVDDSMYAQPRGISSRDYSKEEWDRFFIPKGTYHPEVYDDIYQKRKANHKKPKSKRKVCKCKRK